MDTGTYGLLNAEEAMLWGPGSKSPPPLAKKKAGKRKTRRSTRKSKKTRKNRK